MSGVTEGIGPRPRKSVRIGSRGISHRSEYFDLSLSHHKSHFLFFSFFLFSSCILPSISFRRPFFLVSFTNYFGTPVFS